MKRKVFIAIAAAMISASASVSFAQVKTPLPSSQPSKSVPALSEEQVKRLIQAETEKKVALRGQAEAEGKFNFTMVWVQVLLGGVSALLAFIPILFLLIGYILWACRKAILGQLNTEAMEEVGRRVEEHLKITIDTEVKAQILNQLVQEFKAAVPASTQETPSPEKLSQIEELRRRIEDLQDLMPTMMMMQSAEYYVKQGNAFYFEKRYEEAISSYDKALEFNPNDSEVWSNRGVVLGELKRYEEAITSFSKAIEFEPNNSITWSNRGIALGYLKRYEEAISSYDKALEFKPDDSEVWSNRGIVLFELKRYEDAILSYDKALKFRPDYSLAWSNRGIALSYLKRYEEALNSHDKAIELNPDFPEAFYNRACCYALQEKVAETVHDLKRAIELDSTHREKAKTESDFDKVRQDESIQKLLKNEP
jgi:tetratricopeptide (TPR) repeat protein